MGMAAITRFGRLANERKQVCDAKRRVVRADVPLNMQQSNSHITRLKNKEMIFCT
jgi:hypothetical protein